MMGVPFAGFFHGPYLPEQQPKPSRVGSCDVEQDQVGGSARGQYQGVSSSSAQTACGARCSTYCPEHRKVGTAVVDDGIFMVVPQVTIPTVQRQ